MPPRLKPPYDNLLRRGAIITRLKLAGIQRCLSQFKYCQSRREEANKLRIILRSTNSPGSFRSTHTRHVCQCRKPPLVSVPMVPLSGAIGTVTLKTLSRISRQASCLSEIPNMKALNSILALVSCALKKFVAVEVIIRCNPFPAVRHVPSPV